MHVVRRTTLPEPLRINRAQSVPETETASDLVDVVVKRSVRRASSFHSVYHRDVMDTREIKALLQELSYHTDLSRKQLQELGQRIHHAASAEQSPSAPEQALSEDSPKAPTTASLEQVLAEFQLPTDPEELRRALARELQPPFVSRSSSLKPFSRDRADTRDSRSHSISLDLTRAISCRSDSLAGSDCGTSRSPRPDAAAKPGDVGDRLRMAVRCEISRFLKESRNRVKIIMLWRHEAASLPAVQQSGSALGGQLGEKWYERLYTASETMLSNLVDENDSPLREVLFDLVSFEAHRAAWPEEEPTTRPAQVESIRKVFRCFVDAVLAMCDRPNPVRRERCEKSQWVDCLSRLAAQFERSLEETWRCLWPGRQGPAVDGYSEDGATQSPLATLRKVLLRSSENASLLSVATTAIVDSAEALSTESERDPEDFWDAYLRQAIRVSKGFLQLARELTVLTGLWISGQSTEGEHLRLAVQRQEYHRVRRAFADVLLKQSRHILGVWHERIATEVSAFAVFLELHKERLTIRNLLMAVIEWWRTGHSGKLRTVCMDLVALRFDEHNESGLELEEVQDVLPIVEGAALEALHRELTVRSEHELSAADEPRIRDILSRLTYELGRHIEGEWHIAETARSTTHDVLPPPKLFQVPHWKPPTPFDFGACKTAFLGSEISGRFVVTQYVNRGAMGRVWVVEDLLGQTEFPLCLKTFYCECECEEMNNLPAPEFKRCVLEELSQVERWLTSRTRLALSRHLVHVVRVFRDAPVVRQSGDVQVEGMLNGILMEFCDKGELTSYLWDDKTYAPRAFDEETAQFLFAQLMELLVELFAPAQPAPSNGTENSDVEPDNSVGAVTEPENSVGALYNLSVAVNGEEVSMGSHQPIKYFHNDIKTENLVISGATLKLIDFQSLTPLRPSRCCLHPQLEHATLEYQHQHPSALSEAPAEHAEGVALWACGVILTRLLAAELSSDWVYRHRGLGSQEELQSRLPEEHCLLEMYELGPRDLLDKIFASDETPSLVDVLAHPWVRSARRMWNSGIGIVAMKAGLDELRPQGCDPRKDLIAWIPLTGSVIVEGRPPPVQDIEEIIQIAIGISAGHFRQDGHRCRKGDGAEDLHEWHVITCDTAVDDGDASLSAASIGHSATPTINIGVGSPTAAAGPGSRSPPGKTGMWHTLRTRLVLDRFCIQVRARDHVGEDEPTGIWWLRVRWLPAMVAGKKDTLGGLTMGRRRVEGRVYVVECGGFVFLQQLLLEGRNEVTQRLQRSNTPRVVSRGAPLLPIFGR